MSMRFLQPQFLRGFYPNLLKAQSLLLGTLVAVGLGACSENHASLSEHCDKTPDGTSYCQSEKVEYIVTSDKQSGNFGHALGPEMKAAFSNEIIPGACLVYGPYEHQPVPGRIDASMKIWAGISDKFVGTIIELFSIPPIRSIYTGIGTSEKIVAVTQNQRKLVPHTRIMNETAFKVDLVSHQNGVLGSSLGKESEKFVRFRDFVCDDLEGDPLGTEELKVKCSFLDTINFSIRAEVPQQYVEVRVCQVSGELDFIASFETHLSFSW